MDALLHYFDQSLNQISIQYQQNFHKLILKFFYRTKTYKIEYEKLKSLGEQVNFFYQAFKIFSIILKKYQNIVIIFVFFDIKYHDTKYI